MSPKSLITEEPADFDFVSPSNIFPKSKKSLLLKDSRLNNTFSNNLYFKPLINEDIKTKIYQ